MQNNCTPPFYTFFLTVGKLKAMILTCSLMTLLACEKKGIDPIIRGTLQKCVIVEESYQYSENQINGVLRHVYDEKGHKVKTIRTTESGEIHQTFFINTYNKQGQLISKERKSDHTTESITQFTYHENGQLKSEEINTLAVNHVSLNEYDDRENLIKTTLFRPSGITIDSYSYNEADLLTEYYSVVHGKPYIRRLHTYNSYNLKTSYTQELLQQNRKSVVHYHYNDKQQLIQEDWHIGSAEHLTLHTTVSHDYDDDVLHSSLRIAQNEPHHEHNAYHYDNEDRLILVEQTFDGEHYYKIKEISYHPNGQEHTISDYKAITLQTPSISSYLSLETIKDAEGKTLSTTKTNQSGSVEWKWSYVYNCLQVTL